jgi:hypothetical protein
MMKALRRSSIHVWFADFMEALAQTQNNTTVQYPLRAATGKRTNLSAR